MTAHDAIDQLRPHRPQEAEVLLALHTARTEAERQSAVQRLMDLTLDAADAFVRARDAVLAALPSAAGMGC